jgi:glutaminyl-peptide cyclotransferase
VGPRHRNEVSGGNISRVPQPPAVRKLTASCLAVVLVCLLSGCGGDGNTSEATTDVTALGQPGGAPGAYQVRVLNRYPHDTTAYTQGLLWAGAGQLFESTGRKGQSSLRRVDIVSGDVEKIHELDPEFFAEGLARVDRDLIQLTWKEGTAFVYDTKSFDQKSTFAYETEGWGLCYDGTDLVMSDGSSTLTLRDPLTFEELRRISVKDAGIAVSSLNELECVGDRVYANVLGDDDIYEIDVADGSVTGVIDASSLFPEHNAANGEVLNGIAFNPETGTFYLTGKNWPTLFEVTFEPATT